MIIEALLNGASQILEAFSKAVERVAGRVILLDEIMLDPGCFGCLQDRRKIERSRSDGLEILSWNVFVVLHRRALRLVLQVYQRNPARVLLQHLHRIVSANAYPENIHLETHQLWIYALH